MSSLVNFVVSTVLSGGRLDCGDQPVFESGLCCMTQLCDLWAGKREIYMSCCMWVPNTGTCQLLISLMIYFGYLPIYLPTILPTYLPTYLFTKLVIYLPTCTLVVWVHSIPRTAVAWEESVENAGGGVNGVGLKSAENPAYRRKWFLSGSTGTSRPEISPPFTHLAEAKLRQVAGRPDFWWERLWLASAAWVQGP